MLKICVLRLCLKLTRVSRSPSIWRSPGDCSRPLDRQLKRLSLRTWFVSVEQWSLGCWRNEDVVVPGRYRQTQQILLGTRVSDCHEPWTSGVSPCTRSAKWLVASELSAAPSVPNEQGHVNRDQVWLVQWHSVHVVEGGWLTEAAHVESCCSSRGDWKRRQTPVAWWFLCQHDVWAAVIVEDGRNKCWLSCWRVSS